MMDNVTALRSYGRGSPSREMLLKLVNLDSSIDQGFAISLFTVMSPITFDEYQWQIEYRQWTCCTNITTNQVRCWELVFLNRLCSILDNHLHQISFEICQSSSSFFLSSSNISLISVQKINSSFVVQSLHGTNIPLNFNHQPLVEPLDSPSSINYPNISVRHINSTMGNSSMFLNNYPKK